MKTGWKREESSIAAVCGGRFTGTQERVTQPASGSGSGEAGEQREQEQEEAGKEEAGKEEGGLGPGSGMASLIIIKALVSITVTTWADLCVITGRLRGHLVWGFFYSLRFECIITM